jgi:hypothetical protein
MASHALTAEPTDAELDHLVDDLRTFNRTSFLAYSISVGQHLVDRCFGGDHAAVRDHAPNKANSFTALLSRRRNELHDLDLAGSTLRRYMAAAEVWHGLPDHVRTQLGLQHLQLLGSVRDEVERKRLAHDAAQMHWTRDQVAVAVKASVTAARKGAKKPGRKPLPASVKAAGALRQAVANLEKHAGASASLGATHHAQWLQALESAHEWLGKLVAQGRRRAKPSARS